MDWLDTAVRIASIANFIIFLQSGVYPTLADRLIGLRPVSVSSSGRVVGYSYMTRELLWHGFIVSYSCYFHKFYLDSVESGKKDN